MGTRLQLLLVDDHAVFRQSVARALAAEPDFEVVDCASVTEALQVIAIRPIDIVLLDHDLGPERASQFLPGAAKLGFSGKVLIVTAWVSDTEARRLVHQGVAGIFRKESPLSVLAESIRAIAAGNTWFEERYRAALDPKAGKAQSYEVKFNELERKVLSYLLEGLSNKEIAAHLAISEAYVKVILQRLFCKTGVKTRGHLVRVVLEQYRDQL